MNRRGTEIRRGRRGLCVLLSLLCVSAVLLRCEARADPYGERPIRREGFAVGIGIGPSLYRGWSGLGEVQGVGGDFNLRLGTVATDRLLWMLELHAGGYLENESTLSGSDTTYTSLGTLTVGGQLYMREALWFRGGAGLATFAERAGRSGPVDEDSQRAGLGVVVGGGYDAFRRGGVVLSIEPVGTLGVFRNGTVGHGALLLGLSWY